MQSTFLHAAAWRRWAVAGLLSCLAASAAQARVGWALDIGVGFPVTGAWGPGYGYNGYGGHGYGGYGYGSAIGVHVGGGRYWRHGGHRYRGGWGPGWGVMVAPSIVWPMVVRPAEAPVAYASPPLPVAPSRPEPVVYPRNGQGAAQTEADRQDCDRWATTQPAALADAGVFQRAVEACMDGRGYTLK